jgi:site-specific DNA-methyltransferase (adenine-specific)
MVNKLNFLKFENKDCETFLSGLDKDSVDLVLTDPPYITSRDSGMDRWVDWVKEQKSPEAEMVKTEEDFQNLKTSEQWDAWFSKNNKKEITDIEKKKKLQKLKEDYMRYGSIYGEKYAVRTNYGEWDSNYTLDELCLATKHFYRILKPGGSCIVFFDLWKITDLKNCLEEAGFKQLRFIEWIKTNPQPINSKRNYLTNCREIAVTAVKGGNSTFNSSYDNGIYQHPIYSGRDRFHPTQKSLNLFTDLVKKHSNEGDIVLDCYAGSATTAISCLETNRNFIGCEVNKEYFTKSLERIKTYKQKEDSK